MKPTMRAVIPAHGIPAWTDEIAQTAIGKPFTDKPGGRQIGKVIAAYVADGDLHLTVELDPTSVDLSALHEVRQVSLIPTPHMPL